MAPKDRYEPLPALPALPAWVWRRMGRPARIATVLVVLAVVGAAAAAVPGLRESQREAARRVQLERAEQRAELIRRLQAEQRPRAGRLDTRAAAGAPAPDRLAARSRMLADLGGAIAVDARRRVARGEFDGRIRRVDCEPFPRSVGRRGPHEDLSRRSGRYSCIAVIAEFERTAANPAGVIGHRYRARVDFATGRYGFCKISGRPGPEREQLVTVPRACGG